MTTNDTLETTVVIDEQTFEHIVLFVLQDLPELDPGKRYTITLTPLPDTEAILPPEDWHNGNA